MKLYPQFVKNVRVKDKNMAVNDKAVQDKLREVEKMIDGCGRVLLRQSGTEPVIRIMVENENKDNCQKYADVIAEELIKGGHSVE